jgi:trk system potassium uptake protein TrkA
MQIVVCGAGKSGSSIAEKLSQLGNEVTIIDSSSNLVKNLTSKLDIRGVVGHGAHPDILERAGARDADMLIAITSSDEVNMLACQIAHSIFEVPKRIARIRDKSYLNPSHQDLFTSEKLPVSVIISPEKEVAKNVLRRLEIPGAIENIPFIEDKLKFLAVKIEDNCPIVETEIGELTNLFPDLKTVIVGLLRDGEILIPKTNDKLIINDIAYIICPKELSRRVVSIFGHPEKEARKVVLIGGGSVGSEVATMIDYSTAKINLTVIENNASNASFLADKLKNVRVLKGSGVDRDILHEADIENTETLVSLTDSDETNFLSAAFSSSEGCKRSLALLNNSDFQSLIKSLKIGEFIDPKAITISSILRHVRKGHIKRIYSLTEGNAEVIEGEVSVSSELIGPSIEEMQLPSGLRIGGIMRKDKFVMPTGSTCIKEGDEIVIFSRSECIHMVEKFFRVSPDFY